MNQILLAVITTACTVAASLLVTYIFNKVSGLPKRISEEKKAHTQTIDDLKKRDTEIEVQAAKDKEELLARITALEETTSHYPEYRAQSLQIQAQLQQSDRNILEVCDSIKAIGEKLNDRLIELERREKNTLRKKILDEYRLYTDEHKNPQQAWTEMEHHSFFKLVEDYESLGGNDYVHSVVLPAMNELDVIPMSKLEQIKNLYNSRSAN